MSAEQFTNDGSSTLNGAINNSVTSLVVVSAAGFPSAPQFRIRIDDEIMLVTAVSGTTFTVTRAVEPVNGVTAAASHASGATVGHVETAASRSSFNNALLGYTTTITVAAATTTLTAASTFQQYFTGSNTQNCKLPATSTLSLGHRFHIINRSSQGITILSNDGTNQLTLGAQESAVATCKSTGNDAFGWDLLVLPYLNSGQMINDLGTIVVDWKNTYLFDASSGFSLEWNARQFYDATGLTFSIDYNARILYASDGATPVLQWSTQPSTTGTVIGFTANASANPVFKESTFTGNVGSTAYTLGDIVNALKTLGLIAS